MLLKIRRTAILGMLIVAYAYFQAAGDSAALASIGLLSFAAIAQFAPAFFGGLFWRRANARGALWAMGAGFAMWCYTLFLPTLVDAQIPLLVDGPFGISQLRPQALFGTDLPPLIHGVLFSLAGNCLTLVLFSLSRETHAVERMQANSFWFFGRNSATAVRRGEASITVGELQEKVSNYLGVERSERAFTLHARGRDQALDPRELADDDLMHLSEHLLASAIGAASSRLEMSLMLQRHGQSSRSTLELLDDASEALQQNRGMLQTAIDQVEQGISVFDADFRLSSWNRRFRELLDLPAELGQPGTSLSKIADAISRRCEWRDEDTLDFAKRVLEIDRPWQIRVNKTGQVIEVQTKALPGGGHVISWHDMTERVNAALALQNANETLERRVEERTRELTRLNADLAKAREAAEAANLGKTKFLAAVGHDILQPLNAARLYSSSLLEQLKETPQRDLVSNVDHSLESVEDILGAVLAISRLDSGALVPNLTDFHVATLFARLDVEFRPMAEAKGLDLQIVENQFAIRSDFNLLRRLLQNLVSNAIKYTDKGVVRLDAKLKRNRLVFEISDTGDGMDTSDHETAFQEFKRLASGKKMAAGLGLGLSIVRRLSETLGHKVNMESTPGKGTTFRVEVPLAKGVVKAKAVPAKSVGEGGTLAGLKVACLDNEARILDGMKSLLGGWGCDVTTFEDKGSLFASLANDRPAILIADYHLETGTGLEAIADVRAVLGEDFPAVLVTADRSGDVRDEAQGVDVTMLHKPLKPAALRAVLHRHVRADASLEAAE